MIVKFVWQTHDQAVIIEPQDDREKALLATLPKKMECDVETTRQPYDSAQRVDRIRLVLRPAIERNTVTPTPIAADA